MNKTSLSVINYVFFPKVGSSVVLNKVWGTKNTIQYRSVSARVIALGPKQMKVRTAGRKVYVLWNSQESPYSKYTNSRP